MPQPPYYYRSANAPILDLTDLGTILSDSETSRQTAFDLSRKIHVQLVKARADLELPSTTNEMTSNTLMEVKNLLEEAIATDKTQNPQRAHPRAWREANLTNRVEEYLRLYSFHSFLVTGKLVPPSQCLEAATDEEYLAGAVMGVSQDLARYGIGRATARDLVSVQLTRDLVQDVLEYLLKFDFRNGPLRRKYDGIKYALKTLETLLYELSVTGATALEPEPKRARTEKESALTNPEELEDLRQRMEHRDELREKLIKKCRDGQKAAKQAIYALHRGDKAKADRLLEQCQECISNELLPIVEEEPPLRSGSFSNVMEEYVEAKLFHAWLFGKDGVNDSEQAAGTLLTPADFGFSLEPAEYLGGICDLTGEIGRYAVQRGTARDADGVRMCLEANSAVLTAIQTMDRYPGNIGKKMDQLRRSVEKLERMTYEMSLSEATGRKIDSEAVQSPPETGE